jgi:hypothetical protein
MNPRRLIGPVQRAMGDLLDEVMTLVCWTLGKETVD